MNQMIGMCTFKVIDYIKKHEFFPEAGAELYKDIVKFIDSKEEIVIDGKDAGGIPTLFLNTSIGRLFEDYGYERFKGRISLINLSKFEADYFQRYINHFIQKSGV